MDDTIIVRKAAVDSKDRFPEEIGTLTNGLHDDAHLGRVQYGTDHLTDRFNGMEFIFTKQLKYALECEVRALITSYDPLGSGDRHFDLNNSPHVVQWNWTLTNTKEVRDACALIEPRSKSKTSLTVEESYL